jgi:sulfate adenylyltransferase subunit 1 (EFTu-like GTPase family)
MIKNNYLMGQEYMIRLENELLIERIAKIEKELGIKEKENKELRIQLKMVNLAMADVS